MTVEEFAQREEVLLALIHDKLKSGSYRFKPGGYSSQKKGHPRRGSFRMPVVMDRM